MRFDQSGSLAPASWLAVVSVLIVLATGCPSQQPGGGNGNSNTNTNTNTNDNINDNGDPTPGDPLRIQVTIIGDGDVDQDSDEGLVTLTATPDEGFLFAGWSGADLVDPQANPVTVDPKEVPGILATFEAMSGCTTDADCDDGIFCNGIESCEGFVCGAGSAPCNADEECSEASAACVGDSDGDGLLDNADNCPGDANPDQTDSDGNGVGDACEGDQDGDGVKDEDDNCVAVSNANQADTDGDALGNACDTCPNDVDNDRDKDGVCGDVDDCPDTELRAQVDDSGCKVAGPPPPPPPPDCGNDELDDGEECDDGNTVSGDGCDSNCTTTRCGNAIKAGTEECDDGNTASGDGCDGSCLVETGSPANDNLADAIAISDGVTPFSNVGAATDGPAEPGCDFLVADNQVNSDVWFCYTATCSDEVVMSLCGTRFDTMMTVYEGCGAVAAAPIGCSDDDCGIGGLDSRISFQTTAGESYLIRIGGFENAQGAGELTIRCGVETCSPDSGDCRSEHEGPGCDDAECCDTVCEVDAFCCDVTWDEFCAGEAVGLCDGNFEACGPGAGACDLANDSGGCEEADCCNTVCAVDPFCCVDHWDELCEEAALFTECFLVCGPGAGECFLPEGNGSAGCEDRTCCESVCTDDPICCEVLWDEQCAVSAAALCR